MINRANSMEDKQEVYRMWKNIFSEDDGGYTDFYFKTYYRNKDTLVYKEDNEILGCATKSAHDVMLHGRLLRCSMIVGVAVKPQARSRGIMHEMMDVLLDEIDHQELITMIQAYQPSLYIPFGFETIYRRRRWALKRAEVKKVYPNITTNIYPKDCLKVYASFVSRFNGYVIRDLVYFENLMNEVVAESGKMIAYYNERREIEGYATLYLENGKLVIRECIYLNSIALLNMINYCLTLKTEVFLECSDSENLSKVFPYSHFEEMGYTMVRLNNRELFNRLFNCSVKDVKEAMNLYHKPLYMHENR